MGDGQVLFSRRLPGSKVAWEFQPQRPDVDHFNRDFKPQLARGGTEICRLDPASGKVDRLTQCMPPAWDFRASQSPDGQYLVFLRALTGAMPSLWIAQSDGSAPHLLSDGVGGRGADHPRWIG
jgi:TolB protein